VKSHWKGPQEDGITYSMLSRFFLCRERFRVMAVEGLYPKDTFSHRIEFGNMWHLLEEGGKLHKYTSKLFEKYPLEQEQIMHWANVCRVSHGVYLDWKKNNTALVQGHPLFREKTFSTKHPLPSGRHVLLRGKLDGVDTLDENRRLYLVENKTKSDIDENKMQTQLRFDMQTMMYLVAMKHYGYKPKGVIYNVIRRPLSGGKGTIRKHKPTKSNPQGETDEEFYTRLENDYLRKEPDHYFMQWVVEIGEHDIKNFCQQFLDPVLESLCDWWDEMKLRDARGAGPFDSQPDSVCEHYRTPYGLYNVLAEGGHTELDEYLDTGSQLGLEVRGKLFEVSDAPVSN